MSDQSDLFTALSSQLDFDPNFFVENTDAFIREGTRLLLPVGTEVGVMSKVGDHSIMTYVEFKGASLTEIRVARRQRFMSEAVEAAGLPAEYIQASGSLAQCRFDIYVEVNDDERVTLTEFLRMWISATSGKEISMEKFQATCERMLFTPWRQQPLMFNHNGVPEARWAEIAEHLISLGAVDMTAERRKSAENTQVGDIIQALHLNPDQAPVSVLEISPADRSKSIYTQGFTDLAEAAATNFIRIVSIRKAQKAAEAKLKVMRENGEITEESERELSEQIDDLNRAARSGAASWGGAHQRMVQDEATGLVRTDGDQWYITNVPVGRMTIGGSGLTKADGTEVPETEPFLIDLWTDPAASVAAAKSAAITTIDDIDDVGIVSEPSDEADEAEKEPF